MKTSRIFLIILTIIIILPLTGRLLWELKKRRTLDIMIINKSVPEVSKNELKGLNWTLNINKLERSSGYAYNFRTDYYGFHPDAISKELMIRSFRLDQIESLADKNQALFYIDSEGVDITGKGLLGRRSWYGGLNQNDYLLVKKMIENRKLVLAEYNFFSEPTEDLVRYNMEQLLDIFYVGWKGKYFSNLNAQRISGEFQDSWFKTYEELSGKKWNFDGPGIVLVNNSQNRIIVLPAFEYMISKYPVVKSDKEKVSLFKLPESASYTGWFYIVYHGRNNIISNFDLNLNERGIELLHDNGLSPVFPAVICTPDKRFYFVAGDFSKSNIYMAGSKVCVVSPILMNLSGKFTGNPGMFFQTYYNRLLSSILNNYLSETGIE